MALVALVVIFFLPAAGPAGAGPKDPPAVKAQKAAAIKVLEQEIRMLRAQETMGLKTLDARYNFITRYLAPHEVHQQMEAVALVLHNVHETLTIGNFDYGGNRKAALASVEVAEHHVRNALRINTFEERALAAKQLQVAHVDLNKAVEYSLKKYGLGTGKETGEAETRATANRQLADSDQKIEFTYFLLTAVNHEITDFQVEKRNLLAQRELDKKVMRQQVALQIKQLEGQIKALRK